MSTEPVVLRGDKQCPHGYTKRDACWDCVNEDLEKAELEIERLRAALDEVGRLADFGWGTTSANEALKKIQVLSAALEHPPTLTPHNDWEVVSGRGGPRKRCRICGWLGLPVENHCEHVVRVFSLGPHGAHEPAPCPWCKQAEIERLRAANERLEAAWDRALKLANEAHEDAQSAFDRGYDKGHHDGALGIVPATLPTDEAAPAGAQEPLCTDPRGHKFHRPTPDQPWVCPSCGLTKAEL